MERSRYSRELVHCNVGTMGVFEADKTTLGVALANTLNYHYGTGDEYSLDNEDNVKEMEVNSFLINAVQTNYETDSREYTHIDCLNSEDCMKHMLIGTPSMDTVILVLDAREGITPEIREQLYMANKIGIYYLVVFVDYCDLIDDEQLDNMDEEIWEIIEEYGYPAYETPIVKGSIQGALEDTDSEWGHKMLELAEILDEYIPDPEKDIDKPFVMPIKELFTVTGRGTVAVGVIESGIIKLNDRLEVVGYNEENLSVVATGIEMYRKLLDSAEAGQDVGILLRGIERQDVKVGQILTKSWGSTKAHAKFTAMIYFLKEEEGGRYDTISDGHEAFFHIRTADVSGVMSFVDAGECKAGEYAEVNVKLSEPLAMEQGLAFWVCDSQGNEIGCGKIAEIL